jgi:tetratricopeptide (TPR) repeat protein
MTLSLCMIVRDEADRIGDCLRSLRGLADETIVVDTGSTDATAAHARDCGARVLDFAWCDDFSAARNHAIDNAKGDWILVLDVDERLYPRHFDAVRRVTSNASAQAIQVFVRTYTDDADLLYWQPIDPAHTEARDFCGYYDTAQVRLFRRRDDVRFAGIVHETVMPALERKGLYTYRADMLLHHYREARPGQQKEGRARQILALCRRRCERESNDAGVWRMRALDALELGEQEEAVEALERAVQLAPERRDLALQLGMVLTQTGRATTACDKLRQALERFPDEPELVQALGEAQLAAGRPGDARETLARSLELDPYLYRALLGLGAIAMQEGRAETAIDYFAKATSIHPGLDMPRVNTGLLHVERGELDKALTSFRRAFASNPRRWQSLAGIGQILFQTERFEEAHEWYCRAVEAKDCAPEVFVKLCACCMALGRDAEARTWADKAAAADPAYGSVRLMFPAGH